jgi:chemotaxis signal transduction protein
MEQQPRTLQLFSSGGAQYAVFADEVMSITEWREPAVLPHAPATVLGVVSIHGRIFTVLDLLQLLESQQRADSPSHILALSGEEQLALAIGTPGETMENSIPDADGDSETLPEGNGKLIYGVINRNGYEIRILNVKEFFSAAIQGRERRRRRF